MTLRIGDRVIASGKGGQGNLWESQAIIVGETEEGNRVCFETPDRQGTWVRRTRRGLYEIRLGNDFYVRLDPLPCSVNLILELEKECLI